MTILSSDSSQKKANNFTELQTCEPTTATRKSQLNYVGFELVSQQNSKQ